MRGGGGGWGRARSGCEAVVLEVVVRRSVGSDGRGDGGRRSGGGGCGDVGSRSGDGFSWRSGCCQ